MAEIGISDAQIRAPATGRKYHHRATPGHGRAVPGMGPTGQAGRHSFHRREYWVPFLRVYPSIEIVIFLE